MANAYKCDRCKAYRDGEPTNFAVYSSKGISFGRGDEVVQYELCDDCLEEMTDKVVI